MRIPHAIAVGAITAVLLSGGGVAASAATPSDAPAADRTHAVAASGPTAGFAGAGFAGGGVAIAGAIFSYSSWSIDQCSKNGSGVELLFAGFVCWAQ